MGVDVSYEQGTPVHAFFSGLHGELSGVVQESWKVVPSIGICRSRASCSPATLPRRTGLQKKERRRLCHGIFGYIQRWVGPRIEHRLSSRDLTRVTSKTVSI